MPQRKAPERKASAPSNLTIEDTATFRARLAEKKGVPAFDPYGGALPEKPKTRKKDLRKLNDWIAAMKRAKAAKRDEEVARDNAKQGRSKD